MCASTPNTGPDAKPLHVAVAVVQDRHGRVLISRRHDHLHQGGLWEFPGGKLEPGEDVGQALARELEEELGIRPTRSRPLIRIPHQYPDRTVLLDVWRVEAFTGEPRGMEGQAVEWLAVDALAQRAFPAANAPILTSLSLPDRYLISPDPDTDSSVFLRSLERAVAGGIRLLALRARSLSLPELEILCDACRDICHRHDARLLLNGDPDLAMALQVDGVHLNSRRLQALDAPLQHAPDFLVAASCHDAGELQQAMLIGADFAVLSPVQATASHPDATPLGWAGLRALTDRVSLPVYALGGMGVNDLDQAVAHGAQGIAAIRGLWPSGGAA